jgi:hypothetical protein
MIMLRFHGEQRNSLHYARSIISWLLASCVTISSSLAWRLFTGDRSRLRRCAKSS